MTNITIEMHDGMYRWCSSDGSASEWFADATSAIIDVYQHHPGAHVCLDELMELEDDIQ